MPPLRTLVLALAALAGCTLGLGPLPADVEALADDLERRGLRLTPYDAAYDRAFDSVDAGAHVVTYEVTALDAERTPGSRGALLDVYRFRSDAAVERGLEGLRRIHATGELYRDGRVVVHARGDAPGLRLALGRRYGAPVQA